MTTTSASPNRLYFGDNLDILRQHVADETVDLIYLDPPFNSNATCNVLFRERSGAESAAQITAFEDTWRWGWESETAFQDVVTRGPDRVGSLLAALRQFLGQNDMMAHLTMMAHHHSLPRPSFPPPAVIPAKAGIHPHAHPVHGRETSEAGFSRFRDYQDWNRSVMEISQSCPIIKSRKSCF